MIYHKFAPARKPVIHSPSDGKIPYAFDQAFYSKSKEIYGYFLENRYNING